jgi:hypothetical protein
MQQTLSLPLVAVWEQVVTEYNEENPDEEESLGTFAKTLRRCSNHFFEIEKPKFMGYSPPILWQMGLLDHKSKIWFGIPRSHKKPDFHFNHQEFSGFQDGRAS